MNIDRDEREDAWANMVAIKAFLEGLTFTSEEKLSDIKAHTNRLEKYLIKTDELVLQEIEKENKK